MWLRLRWFASGCLSGCDLCFAGCFVCGVSWCDLLVGVVVLLGFSFGLRFSVRRSLVCSKWWLVWWFVFEFCAAVDFVGFWLLAVCGF